MEDIFRRNSCEICGSAYLREFASIGHRKIASCEKCGFVFANEFNPFKISETYKKSSAAVFSPEKRAGLEQDARIRQELLGTISKFREMTINHRLLNVSAGSGEFIVALHEQFPSVEISTIEIAEEAASLVKNRIFPDVLIGREAEVCTKISRHFDIITVLQTLEHLYNPLQTLMELYRLLKPGGILFVTVPNINSYQVLLRGIDNNYCFSNEPHLQFYSRKSLEVLLAKAGFRRKKRIISRKCGNACGAGAFLQFILRTLCISNELRYAAFK